MPSQIHFISGLPQAGSTLLTTILKQNPRFHAGIQSPVADVLLGAMRTLSSSESSVFVRDEQRERVLRSLVDAYYADYGPDRVVFDLNRSWCSVLPALARLFPKCRVLCCLRNPAWILDTLERLVQRNVLLASKMFGHEIGNVYSRVEGLMKNHYLAPSMQALRQAWFSEYASMLIGIRHDSLAARPLTVIDQLYDLLDEERFAHDFEHIEHDEAVFDGRLSMPGLHRVADPFDVPKIVSILPPDLFVQHDQEFWARSEENPRQVVVL